MAQKVKLVLSPGFCCSYTGNRVSTNMVLIQVELLSGYSPVEGSLEEVRLQVCDQLGWEWWWMSIMQDCMQNRGHSCGQRNTVLLFPRHLYTQSLF